MKPSVFTKENYTQLLTDLYPHAFHLNLNGFEREKTKRASWVLHWLIPDMRIDLLQDDVAILTLYADTMEFMLEMVNGVSLDEMKLNQYFTMAALRGNLRSGIKEVNGKLMFHGEIMNGFLHAFNTSTAGRKVVRMNYVTSEQETLEDLINQHSIEADGVVNMVTGITAFVNATEQS